MIMPWWVGEWEKKCHITSAWIKQNYPRQHYKQSRAFFLYWFEVFCNMHHGFWKFSKNKIPKHGLNLGHEIQSAYFSNDARNIRYFATRHAKKQKRKKKEDFDEINGAPDLHSEKNPSNHANSSNINWLRFPLKIVNFGQAAPLG